MTTLRAVLVEDDLQQLQFSQEILEAAGFRVSVFTDASTALESTGRWEQPTDLCVLDRRLPLRGGDIALDSNGDELLDAILEAQPDVAVIVFTGHTDVAHVQWSMRNRGSIELRNGAVVVGRVAHFEKGQSIEFEEHVQQVASILSSLDDIELLEDAATETSDLVRRMLRRAGAEFGATCVAAKRLEGGASGSSVWICNASGPEGPIASVVVKRVRKRPTPGGLQSLLPAALTAGNVHTIAGFCGGGYISVLQLAGQDPVSLGGLLVSEPDAAAEHLTSLTANLDSIPAGQTVTRTLAEVAAPFVEWSDLDEVLVEIGLEVPPRTRYATTRVDPQHGDLHPGNVLIVNQGLSLIDFDSQVRGSQLLDPVAALLGPLFHLHSPMRSGAWPSPTECSHLLDEQFLENCPAPGYFREAQSWVKRRAVSDRELWTVILAFAARQLRFDDVTGDPVAAAQAKEICALAVQQLSAT